MRSIVALAVLVLVAGTGCASTDLVEPQTSPNESVTPTPTSTQSETLDVVGQPGGDAVAYATLEEFRLALVAAGEPCDSLTLYGEGAAAYGVCAPGEKWSVSVFPSVTERNAVLQLNADSDEPGTFLVGPNWLLGTGITTTYEDLLHVQPKLWGAVWQKPDPIPAS